MAVQDYKINYKSDFVLNINGDAGWAVPFCIKFWTGMPSQAYFVGFDGVKYVNCRVGDTPTQLLVMFDDHHLPIGPLRMQIAYHTTIEEFPGSVFDEVTNARDVIVTIDGTDYQVLLDFTGEDAPELEFDLPAYANEAERIQNELQRQQNEADRIAAELQREQATAAAVQGAENVNAQLNGTTLTVTNRQGVSTSVNTKGEQGVPGPVGPEGPQGETGISVTGLVKTGETETDTLYNVTFSDGTTQAVAIPKGAKGDTGATGPTGPQGPQGQTGVSITGLVKTGETETDTLYNITFSNGTTQAVDIPKGAKGDQGPVGPQGPQGPMGDVAVITPEQQAAFTMYSEPGQNTNGPMTQKAVTDALVAGSISYDNSQSGLAADNVQGALDGLDNAIRIYSEPVNMTNLFDTAGWTRGKFIAGKSDGQGVGLGDMVSSSSQNSYASGYVDISKYSQITITVPQLNIEGALVGICFYDNEYSPIYGISNGNLSPTGMIPCTCNVPNNAKYIRATKRTDSGFAAFSCYGVVNIVPKDAVSKVLSTNVSQTIYGYYLLGNGQQSAGNTNDIIYEYNINAEEDEVAWISGRAANGTALACAYNSSREFIKLLFAAKSGVVSDYEDVLVEIPDGTSYVMVHTNTNGDVKEPQLFVLNKKSETSQLNLHINSVKSIPFYLGNGVISGYMDKYGDHQGEYFYVDSAKLTNLIDVSNLEYIYYTRVRTPSGGENTFLTASFFNADKNYICGEHSLAGVNKYVPSVVAVPEGAQYLRVSFFVSDFYGRRQILDITDADISSKTIWKTIDNLTFTDAKLINSANGIVSASTSHKCTEDYIDIKDFRGGKMFYPRVYFNSSTQILAGMAFYDKYRNYISGLAAKVGTFDANHHVKTTVDIPSNAYFVRISVLQSSEGPFEITLCSFDSIYNSVKFDDANIDDYDYSYGESESRFRFYKAMEEKLDNYGITDYIIEGPGGYGRSDSANEIPNPVLGHGMCQLPLYGLAKIVSMALNYPTLADIWASTSHIIRTKGVEGEVVVTKTLNGTYGHYLTDYYTILSWKTGTDDVNPVRNLYCTATNDALKGQILSGVISFHRNFENDTYNRFKAMKLLLDIGTAKYFDRNADTSALESSLIAQDISHAQVIVTPTYTRFMKDWNLNSSSYYRLYDYHGGAETMNTMSTVKLLTALVVLDYIEDLDTYVEVSENDLYWGQYPINTVTFSAGAKVTYRDLLYGLLFPSWNQSAYCLARNVGNYLLRTYRGDGFLP